MFTGTTAERRLSYGRRHCTNVTSCSTNSRRGCARCQRAIADARRRERFCSGGCSHWWHRLSVA
ncbi:DUF5958 family protein [Streptomyces fradiae]|uniref:DUF5958 family protein n=1 Tax=Streptomyces fradiae TaxID=1906 RepID=UPI00369B786F